MAEPSEHHQKEELCESSAVDVTAPFMATFKSWVACVVRDHIGACPLWHHMDSSWITDSGEERKVWRVDEPCVYGSEGTRLNFHPENFIGVGVPHKVRCGVISDNQHSSSPSWNHLKARSGNVFVESTWHRHMVLDTKSISEAVHLLCCDFCLNGNGLGGVS